MRLLLRWLADAISDIQLALRGFRNSPALAFVIVVTVALGIGANMTVFSIADTLLLKMLPVPEPDRLVQILQPTLSARSASGSRIGTGYDDRFTFEHYREIRQILLPLAELLSDAAPSSPEAVVDGAVETIQHSAVSGNYFSALGVNAALGRLMDSRIDDEPGRHPEALISYQLWTRRFARDPNVIGRTLQIDATRFEIIGVTEPGYFGLQIGSMTDVWTPIIMETARLRTGFPRWRLIARLRPGIKAEQALSLLQVWFRSRVADQFANRSGDPAQSQFIKTAQIRIIPAAKGVSPLREKYGNPIRLVFALVGVVLMLTCANVSGLLLARADRRQREMAIRRSVGAARNRIVRQLLAESFLLAGIATLIGALAARWAVPILIALLAASDTPVQLKVETDARLVTFAVAVCTFATLACGILPAFRASGVDILSPLKHGARQVTVVSAWQTRFLAGTQIALSLVLLMMSALFVRTLVNLKQLDPGFDRENVVLAYVHFRARVSDAQISQAWQELIRRVRAIGGVESTSISIGGPLLAARWAGELRFADASRNDNLPVAWFVPVSPEFFRTFGRSLVKGRDFESRDFSPSAQGVAIVNETMARQFFGANNPIGRRLNDFGVNAPPNSPTLEIVGVAPDMKFDSMRSPPPAILYLPFTQQGSNHPIALTAMGLALRTRLDSGSLGRVLRQELAAVNPAFVLTKITTQNRLVDDILISERLLATVGSFFAVIALLIASIGLYGTVSYSVTRRTREIGIRMALGAHQRQVLGMVLFEALLTVAVGIAFGAPAAVLTARPVANLLFEIKPQDPVTLLVTTGLLLAISLIAALIPALRASRTAPIEALRSE
jgi:predicted permease